MLIMKNVETVAAKIEELRANLRKLLDEHREIQEPEVLRVSEALDRAIIQYYRLYAIRGTGSNTNKGRV